MKRNIPSHLAADETPKSDSLLMSVKFNHFKKWIKMAANYNLHWMIFLKRMDQSNAQVLMRRL